MNYSNIILKFLNYLNLPGVLIRLNLWSYLNINLFSFKSSTFLYYFLTNLNSLRLKLLFFNKYNNVYFITIFSCIILFTTVFLLFL